MKPFPINHAMKDIPIPSNKSYLEQLTGQVADFVARWKWSAYFQLNKEKAVASKVETFGFRSGYAPPQTTKENYGEHFGLLRRFENFMYSLPRKVTFENHSNNYQKDLNKTVSRIEQCKELIIPADKTRNYFAVKKEDHLK